MKGDMKAPRLAFGEALADIAARTPRLVVLDPDVCTSTQTALLRASCPGQFISAGIAEANAVCMAAGLAACGFIPWVSTFAAFLATRSLDQVRSSVAHTGLPVKLNGAYGGLPSGRGGATHSMMEDIAIMRALPGVIVLSPADSVETAAMTELATFLPGPVYLRTVRCEVPTLFPAGHRPMVGKATILADGSGSGADVAIVAEGMMSARALAASEILAKEGISARVIHMGSIKPIDHETLVSAARDCGAVVTVENHSIMGGLGGAVAEVLSEDSPCPLLRLGTPDIFMESGNDETIFARHSLNAAGIAASAASFIARKGNR